MTCNFFAAVLLFGLSAWHFIPHKSLHIAYDASKMTHDINKSVLLMFMEFPWTSCFCDIFLVLLLYILY